MAVADHDLVFSAPGTQQFQSVGRYIRIRNATSPVYLTIDGRREIVREQGEQIDVGRDSVKILVRCAVAQSVSIISSSDRQDDNRANINAPINAVFDTGNDNSPIPRVTVAPGSSALLVAANANRRALRVSLPSDAAGFVTLGKAGVAAASGGLLEPGTTDYIETTGELRAYNSNASAVNVYVMEINKI